VPEFFILWAHANGAQLLGPDGKTAHLDDPKAVEALAYTKSLIDEQGGWSKFKTFRDTWDFFGKDNQVAADQVGAWPMESWYWNVMAQNSPNVHVAAVPFTDKQGRPFTFFTGSGWAIPKGAKHPALACTWMKTMTSTPTWMTAAKKRAASAKATATRSPVSTPRTPSPTGILNQVYKPNSPQYDKAVKLLVQVQDNAVFWAASPAGTQVQQALTDAINRVLAGTQTPKQALDRAQTEAQKAIDSAT
jgi:multiple sugar transport system substrate-binding protein